MVDASLIAPSLRKVVAQARWCAVLLSMPAAAWAFEPACGPLSHKLRGVDAAAVSAKFTLAARLCGEQALGAADEPRPLGTAGATSHHGSSSTTHLPPDRTRLPVAASAPTATATATAAVTLPAVDNRAPFLTPPPSPPSAIRAPRQAGRKRGNTALTRALLLDRHVAEVAAHYEIDPLLLHAIAHVESRHNASAISHAGAIGLMQVMPATAKRFGVTSPRTQLLDARTSLEVGSAYLKNLQKRFDNDLVLIIAAYNAGEGAVEKHGRRVPPYRETQGYVRAVMAHYKLLAGAREAARLR